MQRYIRLKIVERLFATVENRNHLRNSSFISNQIVVERFYFGRTKATLTAPYGWFPTLLLLLALLFRKYSVQRAQDVERGKLVWLFNHYRLQVLFEPFYK